MKPYIICSRNLLKHPVGYTSMQMHMPVKRRAKPMLERDCTKPRTGLTGCGPYARAAEKSPLFRSMARYRDRVIEILLRQRRYVEAIDLCKKELNGNAERGKEAIAGGKAFDKSLSIEKVKRLVRELQQAGCEDEGLRLFCSAIEFMSAESGLDPSQKR